MQPDQDRLRAIYRRCDVSNNGITDTIGEDEFLALIAREVRLGRLDEVNRWFRLRVNGGDLELRTAGTITRIALNNRDTEAVRMRIAQLKQEVKNNG